jgi:hypothetical protein
LEEPGLGGDTTRGLAIIAQGHFDEQPVAFNTILQLGVQAEHDVLPQRVILGGSGDE